MQRQVVHEEVIRHGSRNFSSLVMLEIEETTVIPMQAWLVAVQALAVEHPYACALQNSSPSTQGNSRPVPAQVTARELTLV